MVVKFMGRDSGRTSSNEYCHREMLTQHSQKSTAGNFTRLEELRPVKKNMYKDNRWMCFLLPKTLLSNQKIS